MSIFRKICTLCSKKKLDADMAEEMRAHLELRTQRNIDAGMLPDEARYAAMRQFGGVEQIKEVAREQRGTLWLEQFLRDLHLAGRQLAKARGFTVVAVLIVAIGIGAATAMFSVVNGVVLRPVPLPGADRLAVVYETNLQRNVPLYSVAYPNFVDWRERARSWASLAAVGWRWMNFTGGSEAEIIIVRPMTAAFLPTLGLRPALGRGFIEDEDKPGRARVAVVSHSFWQRRLGGRTDVLGQALTLDGSSHTVVGVLAADAFFPGDLDVAIPIAADPLNEDRTDHDLEVYGRLKPGVTFEQADAELKTIAAQIGIEHPKMDRGWSTQLLPLARDLVGDNVRTGLFVLLGAVGLLLLITCANFSNLLLVRASARAHEIAVRTALGASRGRVIRQLVTESLFVTSVGGLLGVVMSLWVVGWLRSSELPRATEISVDVRVLAVACGVILLVGCFAGIGPALKASQTRPQEALKGRSARSGHRSRLRDSMVVAQLALSLALVIGATMLIRSFSRLMQVNPGFTTERVLTVGMRRTDNRQSVPFYERVTARVAALPQVAGVGLVSSLPLVSGDTSNNIFPVGRTVLAAGESIQASWRLVDGGYFDAMQIPLLRGRTFAGLSPKEAGPSVVLSASLARMLFGDDNPIGRVVANLRPDGDKLTVIGVVGDVRSARLGAAPTPTFYWSMHRFIYGPMRMVVRTRGEMEPLATAIRSIVKEVDPGVPVFKMRTMADIRTDSLDYERLTSGLLSGFAAAALALAALGTYGVIAFTVQERTREIGIRIAIGAQVGDILRLIFRQGVRLVSLGLIVGLIAALAGTRLLTAMLYETDPADPVSCAVAVAILAFAALGACLLPTVRAAKTDPMVALRAD